MKTFPTDILDVLIVQVDVHQDLRGQFMELFKYDDFPEVCMQDNISRSRKGTIRGLHYQLLNPQAKLVTVIHGSILDVAVDIRLNSPTFGKCVAEVLKADTGRQLFMPEGFAHGFQALEDDTVVFYKCGNYYRPDDTYGIIYNDPEIDIPWRILDVPLTISEADQKQPLLKNAKLI